MRNFNTNQTRHFYTNGIATGVTASIGTVKSAADGDVTHVFVKGVNADGNDYRSDSVAVKNITSLKLTEAAAMATPLLKHTVTINTEAFANAAALAGKTVKLAVTVQQLFDYDDSNCVTFTVEHTVAASETNTVFYKALADAVAKALPTPDKKYPYLEASSDANGLYLTELAQKYVRGKLTGEPVHFAVSFGFAAASYTDDVNIAWGVDAVAASGNVVPANYVLADLEYFAYGERGDYYRGNNWPNNIEPTYVIDPKSTAAYQVLTIEYFYAGGAEDVQKSPRVIQVAGADLSAMLTELKKYLPAQKGDIA